MAASALARTGRLAWCSGPGRVIGGSRTRFLSSAFADLEASAWGDGGVVSSYDAGFARLTAQASPALLDAVRPHTTASAALLDVACGLGGLSRQAKRSGDFSRVVAVDFSPAMIERARALDGGAGCEYLAGNAQNLLEIERESFSAVTCAFGVLHMDDPPAFFAEAYRVLEPGGAFAFAVWQKPPATEGYEIMLGALAQHAEQVPLPEGPPFFEYADAEKVRAALIGVGFSQVKTWQHEMSWELRTPEEFWEAMEDGTARTRATIRAQSAAHRDAVRTAVLDALRARSSAQAPEGGGDAPTHLRMPAAISLGVKPR